MIGDWVYVPKIKKAVRAKAIYPTMIIPNTMDDDIHASIGDEYLEPIPLTAEILEKNGFEKYKYGYFIYKDYDEEVAVQFRDSFAEITHAKYIFNPEDVTEVDFEESLTFKKCYVHNLQHALRDFKLDKKIEL